ncbi:MAG: hypothetical protein IPK82_17235 [Polyangiaceae bacterium]|nr:hypothetical protein [Polyangiaceae bacterium]
MSTHDANLPLFTARNSLRNAAETAAATFRLPRGSRLALAYGHVDTSKDNPAPSSDPSDASKEESSAPDGADANSHSEEATAQKSGEKAESGEAQAAEPSRRAVRFANITIGVAAFLCVSQVIFAFSTHRPTLLRVVPAVLALLFIAAYKLSPARRITLAMVVFPAIFLIYGFEWKIARNRPYAATMAEKQGRSFDDRSLWEVINDERAQGVDAHPSFQPRALMVLDLSRGLSPDELANHQLSPSWGIEVNGERVLPFGGLSNKHIVYCNEGGTWAEYESDEHGFNNPKGIWSQDTIDVGLIGDSFTQAACVGAEENAAHWIRQRFPKTLNVAMAGNGPLIELATLEEYILPRKPKTVFWVYYNNDLGDLDVEKRMPLLMRYLEEEGFTQKLTARQAEVDAGLMTLSKRIGELAPPWPKALSSLGLSRKTAPRWLGDIVMDETHSSATAVMRLDRLSFAATSIFVKDVYNVEADFPLFKRVLARAKSRVEAAGGKFIFVYVADMFYLQYKGKRMHHFRDKVLEITRELGIPVIDTQADFLAVSDPLKVLQHLESHCNPEGYKLLGELMLKGYDQLNK